MATTMTEDGDTELREGLHIDLTLDGMTVGPKGKPGGIMLSCHISEEAYKGDGWPLLQERVAVRTEVVAMCEDGDWESFEGRETNYLSFYMFEGDTTEDVVSSIDSEQNVDFLETELAKESGLPKSEETREAIEAFLKRIEEAEWRLRARMALKAVRQICSREQVQELLNELDTEEVMNS